jgi:hypothetical protein
MPRGQVAAVNQRLVRLGRLDTTSTYPLTNSNTMFSSA